MDWFRFTVQNLFFTVTINDSSEAFEPINALPTYAKVLYFSISGFL